MSTTTPTATLSRAGVQPSEDPMTTVTAPVQEVFSSLQGEGPFVGERQLFVRFAHCHLKCAYCDTPMVSADGLCYVETAPGSSELTTLANPVSVAGLMTVFQQLIPQVRHKAISFTGGEPLLYHRFLAELFPLVKTAFGERPWIYLETSGTQPEFLKAVLPWVDVIAMDIKLPSTTGEAAQFNAHREFLAVAKTNPNARLFAKVVFDHTTPDEEWAAVKATLDDPTIPVFLQPVTDLNSGDVLVPGSAILVAEANLSGFFHEVRVVPQTHKMVKVR